MRGNGPAGAQHVAGDGQFVGRCTDVTGGVMEDEVLEMHQFAVDPQRGAGVGEILSFEEAASDLGARNALIEAGKRGSGVAFSL